MNRPRSFVNVTGHAQGPAIPSENPIMQQNINHNPIFKSVQDDLNVSKDIQKMSFDYLYHASGQLVGQASLPFTILVEQGFSFKGRWLTGSAFSYDEENATDFPIPNSGGFTRHAGRGLVVKITDSSSGRDFTGGYVGFENIFSPGYGINFQSPYPFRTMINKNTKLRFDIRNLDNANRTHDFDIVLGGTKIMTP